MSSKSRKSPENRHTGNKCSRGRQSAESSKSGSKSRSKSPEKSGSAKRGSSKDLKAKSRNPDILLPLKGSILSVAVKAEENEP